MYQVIVIGGGPSGVIAALRARELGATVALIERGEMGGTCTNNGCVPTRVLAHSARLLRDAAQFETYGLIAKPPQIDFGKVMGRVRSVVDNIHEKKQLVDLLASAGVAVYANSGQASFIDPHTIATSSGLTLEAEKFILCVGGRPNRIVFPGSDLALIFDDVWSMEKLPRSIAIAGGAATGCQLASIFSTFGSRVTLLERSPRLLAVEDELVSQAVSSAFERQGIEVVTSLDSIQGITKKDDGLELAYVHQGHPHTVEVETVILAVGWPGNVDTLNLAAAGVETERNYIKVDDYLRTSAPHIFAAGDITGRMMLVQSASSEAMVAAENAILGIGLPQKHKLVPHGGFTDPEYGSVGLTEAKARESYNVEVAVVQFSEMDRAVIDGHTHGFCKLIADAETHRILGAHVAGEQALEVVQLAAAGMAGDIWVEQLADLEISYPTYTAIIGVAARRLVHKLGVRPVSLEWRGLNQSYAAEWEGRLLGQE